MSKIKKYIFMLTGILFIGLCVSFFRLAGFGVDPFTAMNLGISGYIGWSFGTWQLIANVLILVLVFFQARHCIGAGTIVNMVFVGYIADFVCWLVQDVAKIQMAMPSRILALIVAQFLASIGVALYMIANLGIAPYDSVAVIIEKVTKGKIPFHRARVLSDITVVLIGVALSVMSGNGIWAVVGVGTVVNALCNGPMIQFFKDRIEKLVK
nr:hypothetical protein [uncultured Mediterraneibacter sp.]